MITNQTSRDPWMYLSAFWPSVRIVKRALQQGRNGLTWWPAGGESPEIFLNEDLDDIGQRATLAHELMHLERGPVPEHERAKEEADCDRAAARWLLPDVRVIRHLLRTPGIGIRAAAEALRVPRRVLVNRLRHLTVDETYLLNDEEF